MPCQIELHAFEVALSIGCSAEERARPQLVRIALGVESAEKFPASRTDRLQDTLDAAQLLETLERHAPLLRVQTLEHLGERLETELRARFAYPGLEWRLRLHKPEFGWTYVHAWRS